MLPKHYQELMNLAGTPGHEQDIKNYLKTFMKTFPNYDIVTDNLGSIFAYKRSKNEDAPTIMIAGHQDEVGFIVAGVTSLGMLKLVNTGGINGEVFISQVMNVYTHKGMIKGVIGALPPHLKTEQKMTIDDLLLDIGADSKEAVKHAGVQIGDMVLFDNPFSYTFDHKRVISKAIDNRYGCGLAMDAIEAFHDIDLPYHVAIGATVQEEVGLRGAESAVNKIKPNVFIALDASPVNDMTDRDSLAGLGRGCLLRVYDPRNIMPKALLAYFRELANTHGIKAQDYMSKGGTDAAQAFSMHEGILSTTIGLPARYIHSTAAMMDLSDLDEARKMLFAFMHDITPQKIKSLIEA